MLDPIQEAMEKGELGDIDPMSVAPNSNATEPEQEEVSNVPERVQEDPTIKEATPEDIATRLENNDVGATEEARQEGQPQGLNPQQIDLSQFTPETLQRLKAMLNSTPDRPNKKKDGISIELRVIDGKVLKDFGKVYNGYITDPEEPTRKIITPKIKVFFFGEVEPTEVTYTDFMESERRTFKVLATRSEVEEVEEGETNHVETGQLVTMIATYHTFFYTIELPTGDKVEINSKIANA